MKSANIIVNIVEYKIVQVQIIIMFFFCIKTCQTFITISTQKSRSIIVKGIVPDIQYEALKDTKEIHIEKASAK